MRARALTLSFRALALVLLLVGGWAGCRCRPAPSPAANPERSPSVRLVLVSGIAGAIEPCGCVKDMLGGVDHAAAYMKSHAGTPHVVLGAGPMLFMDPVSKGERATQDLWKAEALARSFADLGLRAWAPGANDFAAGAEALSRLAKLPGAPALLAANLAGNVGELRPNAVFMAGGVKVGVAGVALPRHAGKLPAGIEAKPPAPELKAQAAELQRQGAELLVALVALPRGEALRLAELVPEFHVLLIGKSADQGEGNDPITPPTHVGNTLVVEAPNHLQAFYVVDLFVRDGRFEFQNASGRSEERADLDRRIRELESRIAEARENQNAAAADIAAREKDAAALKKQRDGLDGTSAEPAGSYYRATLVEVRESLGSDAAAAARLSDYYRKVNDHNREAFKDLQPVAAAPGQSSYVGVERCATCHQEEHAFFATTRHADAYATLSRQHKEFNLDCVGCHVTGYNEPGGSTVTFVKGLENVQCEVCHGPGSRHLQNPADPSFIEGKPDRALCATKCHHVPHVKPDWSVDEAWKHIIGKGHGR